MKPAAWAKEHDGAQARRERNSAVAVCVAADSGYGQTTRKRFRRPPTFGPTAEDSV